MSLEADFSVTEDTGDPLVDHFSDFVESDVLFFEFLSLEHLDVGLAGRVHFSADSVGVFDHPGELLLAKDLALGEVSVLDGLEHSGGPLLGVVLYDLSLQLLQQVVCLFLYQASAAKRSELFGRHLHRSALRERRGVALIGGLLRCRLGKH